MPLDEPDSLWRLYLSTGGRIDRQSYWRHGVLALIAAGVLLHLLLGIARVPMEHAELMVNLLLIWPAFALNAKRWQDCNKSAWWNLVIFIPVAGVLVMLLHNGLVAGTPGSNRFGDAPCPDLSDQLLT